MLRSGGCTSRATRSVRSLPSPGLSRGLRGRVRVGGCRSRWRTAMKTRRRKTTKRKRGNAPTATRGSRSTAADLQKQLEQRTRELAEALEQQTATSEVLRVISSSPGELKAVFEAILANAVRICEAKFGTLFRYDGKVFHRAAGIGTPAALVEFQERRGPFRPESTGTLARVFRTKEVAHSA